MPKRIKIKILNIGSAAEIMEIAIIFIKKPANVIPAEMTIEIINGTDEDIVEIKNQGFEIEILEKKEGKY